MACQKVFDKYGKRRSTPEKQCTIVDCSPPAPNQPQGNNTSIEFTHLKLGTLVGTHSEVLFFSSLLIYSQKTYTHFVNWEPLPTKGLCLSLCLRSCCPKWALHFQAMINKLCEGFQEDLYVLRLILSQSRDPRVLNISLSKMLILQSDTDNLIGDDDGGCWRLIPSVHQVHSGLSGHELYIKSATIYLNLCCGNLAR